jgi:hypothetical protein
MVDSPLIMVAFFPPMGFEGIISIISPSGHQEIAKTFAE